MARWSLYCFDIPLKSAILAIGYLGIAESALFIYAYIDFYSKIIGLDNDVETDVIARHTGIARACTIVLMVSYGLTIVSNVLLIIGQHKRTPILLKQCFFQTIAKVFCNIAAAVTLVVLHVVKIPTPIATLVMSIFFVYITVVIGKGASVMESENVQMSTITSNVPRAEFPEIPNFFATPAMMRKKDTLTATPSNSNDPFA